MSRRMPVKKNERDLMKMKKITTIGALILVTLVELAQAEPRKTRRSEHKNYILRRQEAGLVSGVPVIRRYRGGRVIDIYRDGSMFEKDNYVGREKR
jgi:hypothetical protein